MTHRELLNYAKLTLVNALRPTADFNPSTDCKDMYGFTIKEACNPHSGKYLLERIVYVYTHTNNKYNTRIYNNKMEFIVDQILVECYDKNLKPVDRQFDAFLKSILKRG